jgi:hypothetical protein
MLLNSLAPGCHRRSGNTTIICINLINGNNGRRRVLARHINMQVSCTANQLRLLFQGRVFLGNLDVYARRRFSLLWFL